MSNVKDINVKVGQNFQIQVPFSGFPKPTAVWMNRIKEIEDDTRVHLKWPMIMCSLQTPRPREEMRADTDSPSITHLDRTPDLSMSMCWVNYINL